MADLKVNFHSAHSSVHNRSKGAKGKHAEGNSAHSTTDVNNVHNSFFFCAASIWLVGVVFRFLSVVEHGDLAKHGRITVCNSNVGKGLVVDSGTGGSGIFVTNDQSNNDLLRGEVSECNRFVNTT